MCVKGLWPYILRAKWESDQKKESGRLSSNFDLVGVLHCAEEWP